MKNQRLVLVGGGHAHVEVLRRWALTPVPKVELVLISGELNPPYSGMIPGVIAGHFSPNESAVDLRALAWRARARLLHDVVTQIDPITRRVYRQRGEAVGYDVLSLNLGSSPALSGIPGASEFGLPVKPIHRLLAGLQRWETQLEAAQAATSRESPPSPFAVVMVGAGAAGCEVLLGMRHRWRKRAKLTWTLIGNELEPLASFPSGVRRRFRRILTEQGIVFKGGQPVVSIDPRTLTLSSGESLPQDALLLATGAAAPSWLAQTGLVLDSAGFIAVDDFLRSRSHPEVFGAGDCVTQINHPRPKAGVFAVRQGPALHENLVRFLRGEALQEFRPQRHFLSILTAGRRHAVANRGPFTLTGDWVWRWKERIDRRWLARYQFSSNTTSQSPETLPG